MAAPTITVLSNNSRKVVIKVTSDENTDADGNITWANLSPLFDAPDASDGSVTGMRQAQKEDLICTRIQAHNSDVTNNGVATSVYWIGASANTLLSSIPNETVDLVLPDGGEKFGAAGKNATNAVLLDTSTLSALASGETFTITMTFGVRRNPATSD